MNNNAVIMNSSSKQALDIIEEAVKCKYLTGGQTYWEYNFTNGWLLRPYTAITRIIRGSSELEVRDTYHIVRKAGDTVYIPAGKWRRSQILSEEGGEFVWSRMQFTVFSGIDILTFFDIPAIFPDDSGDEFEIILSDLNKLENGGSKSLFETAIRKKKLLYDLLFLIIENSTIKENSLEALSRIQRLAPAINYINENFLSPLKVDEIAAIANLSKSQFHRNFRKTFGVPPLEYQKKLRLKEAQQLLLFTDKNIAEITEAAGYDDQFHFSRLFKAHFGLSPLKFRKVNDIKRLSL
jgi:AraC-like DNA-binding protein